VYPQIRDWVILGMKKPRWHANAMAIPSHGGQGGVSRWINESFMSLKFKPGWFYTNPVILKH